MSLLQPSSASSPERHTRYPNFALPPLRSFFTLPDLFEWHSQNSSDHPLYVFEDKPGELRTVYWREAIHGLNRAARLSADAVGQEMKGDAMHPRVIAILASLDSISYAFLLLGIMRAGHIAFPISPRNSPAAVAHLLEQTNACNVFLSPDAAMQNLFASAKSMMSGAMEVKVHPTPTFEDLFHSGSNEAFAPPKRGPDDIAVIYHSSGTTAFPKPVRFKNKALFQYGDAIKASGAGLELCGKVFGMHCTPLFHTMGSFQLTCAATFGVTIAVFKPQTPPVVPNPENILRGMVASRSNHALLPPTFVEIYSRDERSIKILKDLDAVSYGGGPVSKEAGDLLVSRGVSLHCGYGSTESHCITTLYWKDVGGDWEYFIFMPEREVRLFKVGDKEYTFAVMSTKDYSPNAINTTIDGVEGYHFSDIISPHPSRKGLWKIVGREDDQIMHSTGEKTNPGPLEKILMDDPHVSGAVLCGRGRFNVCAIVSPRQDIAFDPNDKSKLAEYRNLIWPTIEKMNAYAPSHSRLFKEMVVITSLDKPLTHTSKGTIRRQACITDYEAEINATYDAFEESSRAETTPPATWDLEGIKDFVRRVVEKVMGEGARIADESDLFEIGLDSLRATWVRNTLFQAIQDRSSGIVRKLPPTLVYDHPTVARLSIALENAVNGLVGDSEYSIEEKRQQLILLVEKYTQNVVNSSTVGTSGSDTSTKKIVLLTGGTGSLGSNVLACLLESRNISKVYAISRTGSTGSSAKERHLEAFGREDISAALLETPKAQFSDGDTAVDRFGMQEDLFNRLREEVTHIIHCAWRVDFNVTVSTFESNIKGVRNLVDFALATKKPVPPKIVFISSIGVFQNWKDGDFAPEIPLVKPDTAIGSGYAESKWVSERILTNATRESRLKATSIRCGQLTGGRSGAWNEHEWFPSLVRSSITLGMFPKVEGVISWISAHDAGGSIVDMLDTNEEVLHIVNPKPVPWNDVASSFAEALGIQLVPYSEWLAALEGRSAALTTEPEEVQKAFVEVPALRLMDFFRVARADIEAGKEALSVVSLASEKAQACSGVLREAKQVSSKDVDRWVIYWRKTGFLPPSSETQSTLS